MRAGAPVVFGPWNLRFHGTSCYLAPMTVRATLVDHATGRVLAETELDPADLPPSFARAEAVLEVGGEPWKVFHAEPDGREAIARAGELRLSLVRASGALTHPHPTRDDSLPELDGARKDGGLALPPGEWRQIELITRSQRAAVDEELAAIESIAQAGKPGAYPSCHVRGRVPTPLAGAHFGRADVLRALEVDEARPLLLRGLGAVRGGFAVPLGESLVYGTVFADEGEKGGSVRALGIAGYVADVGPKLLSLARAEGLLLVDWCGRKVWEPAEEGFVEA